MKMKLISSLIVGSILLGCTTQPEEAPSTPLIKFERVNSCPHDINSFTEGLLVHNGQLFESTGATKQLPQTRSLFGVVNISTGKINVKAELDKVKYFGEGFTFLNGKVFQLTYQSRTGFIYDDSTFNEIGTFKIPSKEGWGLCNNVNTIYKSDGTEKIWSLNPETLVEQDYIQVFTNKGKIGRINELEWVKGQIYANIYQKDGVAIINPVNGAVIAVVDFSSLKKKVTQHEKLDVLNGIAYNPVTKTIFVTGKRWDKLFEVEIVEK